MQTNYWHSLDSGENKDVKFNDLSWYPVRYQLPRSWLETGLYPVRWCWQDTPFLNYWCKLYRYYIEQMNTMPTGCQLNVRGLLGICVLLGQSHFYALCHHDNRVWLALCFNENLNSPLTVDPYFVTVINLLTGYQSRVTLIKKIYFSAVIRLPNVVYQLLDINIDSNGASTCSARLKS